MADTRRMRRPPLDALDRRIVGALQVDGRASWRRIADVLGEPVRTVSRRGTSLIDEGVVRVVGIAAAAPSYLVRLHCAPSRLDRVARALAARRDSVFVYSTADSSEVIAELLLPDATDVSAVLDDLEPLDGVSESHLAPVLHYFRTVAEWRPGLLTDAETAALEPADTPPEQNRPDEILDETDRALVDALVRDGRTPFDILGGIGGFSEATARRRVDALIHRGVVRIRAVVEPAVVGLPLEALLWIQCGPGDAMRVGQELAQSPHVRYAALLLTRSAILADVTSADMPALRDLLTESSWVKDVSGMETDLLVHAYKRSGVVTPVGHGVGLPS
jgi:DNA-binding Lrp family transcriptional regulator